MPIELKITGDVWGEIVAHIDEMHQNIDPTGLSAIEAPAPAPAPASKERLPYVGRNKPAAPGEDVNLRPVRGQNATDLMATLLINPIPGDEYFEGQVGRLPKKMQEELRAKLESGERTTVETETVSIPTPAPMAASAAPAGGADPDDEDDGSDPEMEPEDPEPAGAPENPTQDDLKAAMEAWAGRFGMAAAQAELPKLLGARMRSEVPDDKIGAAIIRIKTDLAKRLAEANG